MKNRYQNILLVLFIFFTWDSVSLAADSNLLPKENIVPLEMQISFYSTNLIVVGEISSIEHDFMFYGYDKNGGLADDPRPELEDSGFPTVDYKVDVYKVLYDPNNIYNGQDILYRTYGDTSSDDFEVFDNLKRGLSVFFLTLNPDGKTFGIRDTKHMINIDSEYPRFRLGRKMEEAVFINKDSGSRKNISSGSLDNEILSIVQKIQPRSPQ